MSRSIPATVVPSVLRWARESIDLQPVAASRKLGLPDNRVEDWESGAVAPTIAQLRKASELYRRPLAVFFLAEPPREFDTMRDFRRISGAQAGAWSQGLHEDYRRAHEQRDVILELADLDDTPVPMDWRIEPLPENDEAIAAAGRQRLLSLGPLPVPSSGDYPYDHLNTWIAALETAGVLVMATTRGQVPVEEMRAFSLYFDEVPVIVVNGADSPRARLFSLLHEYAHLLLHTEGLCDTTTDARTVTPNRQLEARCNSMAAAMLLPRDLVLASEAVRQHRANGPSSWDYAALRQAAGPFGVSAEAFLRRLATLGLVTEAFYAEKREEFLQAYEADAARDRISGGNWYRTTVRDKGKGFVRRVTDAHRRRVIDTYTAVSYLNVKASQLERLAGAAAITNAEAV